MFSASYYSLNGGAAITQASLLFNSVLSGANAYWLIYSAGAPNQLGLVADNGVSIAYVALGTTNTVQK